MLSRGFAIAQVASRQSNARHSRRVGSALFSGSVLLTIGYNTYRTTHPEAKEFCNIHAEHRAIIRRRYYETRKKLSLYVYRETSDGKLACSKPCPNCQKLLLEAGVSRVYFINDNGQPMEIRL